MDHSPQPSFLPTTIDLEDLDSSTDITPEPAYTGETFSSVWYNVKILLAESLHSPLTSFTRCYGMGTAYISSSRLLFKFEPPPTPNHTALSLPLAWFRRECLQVRRAFFDSMHVSGILVPTDIPTLIQMSPLGLTVPGQPMKLRIETLDSEMNNALCGALKEALADTEMVAKNNRLLCQAVEKTLVPTGIGYAFMDPDCPQWLFVARQLRYPHQFAASLIPAQRDR